MVWSFCIYCCVSLHAQQNFTGINDSVINLACGQNCAALNFKVPHLKTSEDYTVTTIPYKPYAFTTPAGNSLDLDKDDLFTDVIDLPFPICFYGATTPYSQVLIGSNGLVTFDVSNAGCHNAYTIDMPIPNAGTGMQCPTSEPEQRKSYYPRAAIMGAYIDLNPEVESTGKKIEWRVEGTAPFRRFVASWNNLAVWNNPGCSKSNPTTFQIVVNEGTSVIEVFIQQKVCNPGTNMANSILGIQNWNRDKAVAVTGRNATVWTAQKEAYRFIPSGATSRFIRSELLEFTTKQVLETAVATESSPGVMDIKFPNKCFAKSTEKFIVRTVYAGECNSTVPIVIDDTITVNTSTIPVTYTTANSGCAVGTGSIRAAVDAAAAGSGPFTYLLNPGAVTIASPDPEATFGDLAAGHYSLTVTAAGGCSKTFPDIEVGSTGTFDISFVANPPSCQGAQNASIIVTPPAGGGPYTYALNNTPMPSNVITGIFGGFSYLLTVTASPACQANATVPTISAGNGKLTAKAVGVPTTCAGLSNGSIVVTPTSGSGPYQYSIDNGTNWVASETFNNLAAGTYTIIVKEGPCISDPLQVVVNVGNGLVITGRSTPASCQGVNNGTVTVEMQNGVPPYTVYLNSTTSITSTSTSISFSNVPAGLYNIMVTDANNCTTIAPGFPVTVGAGNGVVATASTTDVSCFNGVNGTIQITPAGGTAPYGFSLNGAAVQTAPGSYTYTGLPAADVYAVLVSDAAGCTFTLYPLKITQPAIIDIPQPVIQIPLCNGEGNGSITINPVGGTSPYTYSLNGGAFQTSNSFKAAAGNYTVRVQDAKACNAVLNNVIVTDPAQLVATVADRTPASCDGGADGTATINVTGGSGAYQYSSDGSTFQASNVLKLKSGVYTITVKDLNGCSTTIPGVNIGLNNNLTFTPMTDPVAVCEGSNVNLQIISNATSYTWTADHPGLITNPSAASLVVQPHANTVFTVNLQLGVCVAEDDVNVPVLPAPVAEAGPDGEICYGQNYQLQANGGLTYEWTPQRYLSDPYNASPQVLQPDRTTTYTLTAIDANHCRSLITDDVTIKVIPPIRVKITPADTVVFAGAQFQYQASSVADNYSWSPATGLDNPTVANPNVVAPSTVGTVIHYRVDASTAAGCKGGGTAILRVYKGPDIYVANAFSPNNDGKNDVFLPFPVGIRQISYFQVFNRWGQMVFSTTTLQQGWDGRLAGVEQPAGVYTWMIEAVTQDGQKISKKGTVTLVR
jgi:gliding motility-associated-like protein